MTLFSGHVRDGDFSVDRKYKRTRVVYDKYDEIGCGHQIHIDKFEEEAADHPPERSSANLLVVGRDTDSMTSKISSYTKLSARTTHSGAQSSFPRMPTAGRTKSAFPTVSTLPRNSSFQGVKDKKKPDRKISLKTTASVVMALSPEIKGAAPSFPTVPDSPTFLPPDTVGPQITLRQVTFIENIEYENYTRIRLIMISMNRLFE